MPARRVVLVASVAGGRAPKEKPERNLEHLAEALEVDGARLMAAELPLRDVHTGFIEQVRELRERQAIRASCQADARSDLLSSPAASVTCLLRRGTSDSARRARDGRRILIAQCQILSADHRGVRPALESGST